MLTIVIEREAARTFSGTFLRAFHESPHLILRAALGNECYSSFHVIAKETKLEKGWSSIKFTGLVPGISVIESYPGQTRPWALSLCRTACQQFFFFKLLNSSTCRIKSRNLGEDISK